MNLALIIYNFWYAIKPNQTKKRNLFNKRFVKENSKIGDADGAITN